MLKIKDFDKENIVFDNAQISVWKNIKNNKKYITIGQVPNATNDTNEPFHIIYFSMEDYSVHTRDVLEFFEKFIEIK